MQQFDRLLRLNCPYNRGNHRCCRHPASLLVSSDCSRAGDPIREILQRFRTQIAGIAIFTRHKHPCRSFESIDTAIDPRDTGTHTKAVQAIASPTVIDAPNDHIHLAQQSQPDIVTNITLQRQNMDRRIDLPQPIGRHQNFRAPRLGIFSPKQDRPGQIGRFNNIEINDYQMSDTEQYQIFKNLIT